MNVLAERTSPPLRARLVACDCGVPGCSSVFVMMQLVESRPLWLTVGLGLDRTGAEEAVDDMLDDPCQELGDTTLRHLIEAGLAIVGVEWGELEAGGRERLSAQLRAWGAIPPWMERMPAGMLWATRGCVFGRPLTRVPRALYAIAHSYVPEQPEAYEDFDQDVRWGLEVLSRGRAMVRVFKDVPVPAEFLLDMERWDA